MEAPLIGITTTVSLENEGRPDELERIMVGRGYIHEIVRAGGIPILLPFDGGEPLLQRVIGQLDGVVFSGGEDIDPQLYGEKPTPHLGEINPARDRFELALFKAAQEQGLPVLAICRGMQVANIGCGGSLTQHIPGEYPDALPHSDTKEEPRPWSLRVHDVHVRPDTLLAGVLQTSTFSANSLHHQAIKRLGSGLCVNATSPDGIVEGIEGTGRQWLVGVQWHPEVFEHEEGAVDRKLFTAFMAEAAKHMLGK